MTRLTLILGSKNSSSWSLRPWLLARHLGLTFEEELIELDQPDSAVRLAAASPTARVPALRHGTLLLWESLAICEYLCELAGAGHPAERAARAVARSVSAEMHSGFVHLRTQWPMDANALGLRTPMTTELAADIARVQQLWVQCHREFGGGGPWLFGSYCIADAMFAPVALRFRTYGALLESEAQRYQDTVLADPHLQEWLLAAASTG
jgi:glutathione S-transferase